MFGFIERVFGGKNNNGINDGGFQYNSPVVESQYGDFSIQPWCGLDVVNARTFSKQATEMGRYEISYAFHIVWTNWYQDNVLDRPEKDETPEMRRKFYESNQRDQEYLEECRLLIGTRNRLLELLNKHTNGFPRVELKEQIAHSGMTKFGTMCNQLTSGGFLIQQGKLIYPVLDTPISNAQFLEEEISPPGASLLE